MTSDAKKKIAQALATALGLVLVLAVMWKLADLPPEPYPREADKRTLPISPRRIQVYIVKGVGIAPPPGDFRVADLPGMAVPGYSQVLSAQPTEAQKQVRRLFGVQSRLTKSILVFKRPEFSNMHGAIKPTEGKVVPLGRPLDPKRVVELSPQASLVAPVMCLNHKDEAILVPLNLPIVAKDGRIQSWYSAPTFGAVPKAGGTVFALAYEDKMVFVTVEM